MTDIVAGEVVRGVSAVLPGGWEYSAESVDGVHCIGIDMSNGSCNAHLELLNTRSLSPAEFISSYKFSLMQALVEIGARIEEIDPRYPSELRATQDGVAGQIIHIFHPSSPVGHISAITQSQSDLLEVRLIAQSLAIDSSQIQASDDDLVAMKLTPGWEREGL
jgi:hypothetical protein